MAKKVTIELTEVQAGIVLEAVEEWFRLRMGQYSDLANGLAFHGYEHDPENKLAFDRRIVKRNAIQEVIKAMLRIAFSDYGTPGQIEPEVHVAADIWSALRYELSTKEAYMSTPFQMGTEPLPKITVEEKSETLLNIDPLEISPVMADKTIWDKRHRGVR